MLPRGRLAAAVVPVAWKLGERMKMGIVKDRLAEAVKVTLSLPPHSSFSSSALPSRYLSVKRKPSICQRSSTRRRWRS